MPSVPRQAPPWALVDPAGKPVEEVRPIVEEIDRRAQALPAELLPDTTSA